MKRRVLIVPDKFKGSLTARAAAEHIAQGWSTTRPDDELQLLPMSDGGDGFGEVIANLLPVQTQLTSTVNAAHQPIAATWWWQAETQVAILESARVIGLALLPPGQFHPFQLDTQGLGALLKAAEDKGARQCVVGIGGSATNDGGFGMARAMGWRFVDETGQPIIRWTGLARLAALVPPSDRRNPADLRVAVDVQNLLLGPRGASRVYGPQKGLRPDDFALAEECLGRLAERVKLDLGIDSAAVPGAGAAGGLGFGFHAFLNARLESGFELFARYARLEERIKAADLVITGEGAIDDSTRMGKGVGEVARLCGRCGVPCVGLAGVVTLADDEGLGDLFSAVFGMAPDLAPPEEAKAHPEVWLPRLAAKAAASR